MKSRTLGRCEPFMAVPHKVVGVQLSDIKEKEIILGSSVKYQSEQVNPRESKSMKNQSGNVNVSILRCSNSMSHGDQGNARHLKTAFKSNIVNKQKNAITKICGKLVWVIKWHFQNQIKPIRTGMERSRHSWTSFSTGNRMAVLLVSRSASRMKLKWIREMK